MPNSMEQRFTYPWVYYLSSQTKLKWGHSDCVVLCSLESKPFCLIRLTIVFNWVQTWLKTFKSVCCRFHGLFFPRSGMIRAAMEVWWQLFPIITQCSGWNTDLKKKDWIKQPMVCTRQKLKPGYFDRCHRGETTLLATALDLRSEHYESKPNEPFVENPCCYPSHRCFIDTFTSWGLTAKWSPLRSPP